MSRIETAMIHSVFSLLVQDQMQMAVQYPEVQ